MHTNMQKNNSLKTKEAYTNPEVEMIDIAPMENLLNNISNPGGTGDDLDPIEG